MLGWGEQPGKQSFDRPQLQLGRLPGRLRRDGGVPDSRVLGRQRVLLSFVRWVSYGLHCSGRLWLPCDGVHPDPGDHASLLSHSHRQLLLRAGAGFNDNLLQSGWTRWLRWIPWPPNWLHVTGRWDKYPGVSGGWRTCELQEPMHRRCDLCRLPVLCQQLLRVHCLLRYLGCVGGGGDLLSEVLKNQNELRILNGGKTCANKVTCFPIT